MHLIADNDARMRQQLEPIVVAIAATVRTLVRGQTLAVRAAKRPAWRLNELRVRSLHSSRAATRVRPRLPEASIAIVS